MRRARLLRSHMCAGAHLPEALHGVRVAHITDLHIGPQLDGERLDDFVDRVNALDADLIALEVWAVDGGAYRPVRRYSSPAGLTSMGLTEADLAGFRVGIEPPLRVRFGDLDVYTCGPWCQGPLLAQALEDQSCR